jgi:predicted nuclease of restriction endonuclease-like RecB superfamily
MLTKDLLRVSRAGGGYRPRFADRSHRPLAARVIGTYQGHVGQPRGDLEEALTDLERGVPDGSSEAPREREAGEFKLVRGFAALVEREATFETDAAVDPERARRTAFEAAEAVGVVDEDERAEALERAGESLGVPTADLEAALYADLEERQVLTAVEPRWDPDGLVAQYNLSLAQTALFDATEVRVRSSDPKALISAIKRLRLMYEIRRLEGDSTDGLPEREVVVTGPTHLFRATRRYGTRFARLLRTVAAADAWHLEATIDDRGTEQTLELSHEDPVRVPDAEPIADITFDSGVEADFAARFSRLDLDWNLVREPEPLAAGTRVMIPDFAFDYAYDEFRIYFEIMGFWTPEYVEKKLSQLADLEDVDMLVAVDESLGVGEEVAARDHRAITYADAVRVKDVADVLREYERQLVAESAARLPDELRPDEDAIALETVADRRGVSADALADATFPEHERVGRTLIRPAVLESLSDALEPGMALADAERVLERAGVSETSPVLSRLGYRVEWDGLAGGTLVER